MKEFLINLTNAIVTIILFILCTPMGWMGLIILGSMFGGK